MAEMLLKTVPNIFSKGPEGVGQAEWEEVCVIFGTVERWGDVSGPCACRQTKTLAHSHH